MTSDDQDQTLERRAAYARKWRQTPAGQAARERRNVALRATNAARRAASPAPRRGDPAGDPVRAARVRIREMAAARGCDDCRSHDPLAGLMFEQPSDEPVWSLSTLFGDWDALELEAARRLVLCLPCGGGGEMPCRISCVEGGRHAGRGLAS
jgi:hypothetical protein